MHIYFCRSWFSNIVSFRYVSEVLNFLHDAFSIKFYTISSLRSFHDIIYNFLLMRNITRMNFGYWRKSISWKYFMLHEMTMKLHFMKSPERKISQCILPLRAPTLQGFILSCRNFTRWFVRQLSPRRCAEFSFFVDPVLLIILRWRRAFPNQKIIES